MSPKISLEQWRALIAVVDCGSYAQAAEKLHKTQSTVTYAVQKLESLLGVKAFEIQGRKAVLSPTGQVLCRRARALVDEAEALERAAGSLAAGWEPELRIAADMIFPTWMLLRCFARFAEERPQTRIDLLESSLSGTDEALLGGQADLVITTQVLPGFLGKPLLTMHFVAVAHPHHPLHQLRRPITAQDLRAHRQLVIRDSGTRRSGNAGWLGSEQRWTTSNKATSIRAATMGLGFAWYPEDMVREELDRGLLKPLALRDGAQRIAPLYVVFADPDYAGPGARRMAEILHDEVRAQCREHLRNAPGGAPEKLPAMLPPIDESDVDGGAQTAATRGKPRKASAQRTIV